MKFQIRKATKTQAKLRLGIVAPAGSGKTYTALRLAKALAGPDGKTIVIDSERGSSEKYADEFDFMVIPLEEDYSPRTYTEAIKFAESQDPDVIIIDSLSHAWAGLGGALEQVDSLAAKNNNKYAGWRTVTPMHNGMVEAMLQSKCHIIATMRSKTEYVQEKDPQTGKTTIRKVGLAPVQREGMDYEFDVVLDMDWNNNAVVTKTRCKKLTNKTFFQPGEGDVGTVLVEWLSSGEAERPAPVVVVETAKSVDQKTVTQVTGATTINAEEIDGVDKTSKGLVRYASEKYGLDGKAVGAALKEAGMTAFDAARWVEMEGAIKTYVEKLEARKNGSAVTI